MIVSEKTVSDIPGTLLSCGGDLHLYSLIQSLSFRFGVNLSLTRLSASYLVFLIHLVFEVYVEI